MTEPDAGALAAALAAAKQDARRAARRSRDAARLAAPGAPRRAAAHALSALGALRGIARVSGYLPIGSELDPLPLLLALHGFGVPLAMPVVLEPGAPLAFRPWVPGTATRRSAFGVEEPVHGEAVLPDVMLVPLLNFDARGHRLGYGGGYYDRTIAALRAGGPLRALGYAYAAQEVDSVPIGGFDSPLDGVVTEAGFRPVA